jgi:hypothetical protein
MGLAAGAVERAGGALGEIDPSSIGNMSPVAYLATC